MKENLIHYRTCVCNINYHMVWSVKYRRKILNAEVEAYLQELVQEIAEDKGFTVHLFECGEGDHVHCFVSAPPKLSITAIVKYLKGISGRKLFERFPEIKNPVWEGGVGEPFLLGGKGGIGMGKKYRGVIEKQGKGGKGGGGGKGVSKKKPKKGSGEMGNPMGDWVLGAPKLGSV